MALSLSFWLLSVATLFFCSIVLTDAEIFYVKLGDDMNCTYQPSCLTLNEYVTQKEQYFLDNTTFMFLPGIHQLDVQLNVENLSNISFIGREEPLVQVSLSEAVNITWINCDNIELSRLVFFVEGDRLETISALYFCRTIGVLSYLSFLGNRSNIFRAIFLNDSSEIMIYNIHVSGAFSVSGAALCCSRSTVTLYGHNSFTNNLAYRAGGAAELNNCTSILSGNISFRNNTSHLYGGAMYLIYSSLTVSGNISFDSNSVNYGGGAMYIGDSHINVLGNILFLNNSAIIGRGGAVFIGDGYSLFSGNIFMIENMAREGGSMAIMGGKNKLFGNISFINNSAGSNGGAVFLAGGISTFSENISFINNTAVIGGAMAVVRWYI